ncbi:phosphotransferase [Sphingomicrobium sp. XHP0239]|uniref:phosphotransferase n=1 Tax=Sphingomicrobium maritimum TaxID=3133972 RepID=UPI0031CCA4D9
MGRGTGRIAVSRPILITSGAYVGEEMQAEFGRIPPAFLPVGPTYLVRHQLARLPGDADVTLSLPHDFDLEAAQARFLDEAGVRVVRIDPRKSLGMSVFQSVLEMGMGPGIEIVHGDTLVDAPATCTHDGVSIERVSEQYRWGTVETDGDRVTALHSDALRGGDSDEARILSGYFAIGDTQGFLKCLSRSDFRFVKALHLYAQDRDVAAREDIAALDFGHLKTYYSSRHDLASARHFNALEIDDYTVTKRSEQTEKIDAEANWLATVPASLQPFTARMVRHYGEAPSGQYETHYAHFPSLAELSLARPPRIVWRKILESCREFLERAAQETRDEDSGLVWLGIDKLRERLRDYPETMPRRDAPLTINGQSVGTLETIYEGVRARIEDASERPASIMHGDFCFSNILFDPRADRIMLIDPRGLVRGKATLFGDARYDIAKLGHSIVGRYDQIMAGQLVATRSDLGAFELVVDDNDRRDWLEREFLGMRAAGVAFDDPVVGALMVSLFLSMVPLHGDDPERQQTLFANALRLVAAQAADAR